MNRNTIYACFKAQVARQPEARAAFDAHRTLSYYQLDALADTIISRFVNIPQGRVAIVMDHSVEMLAAMLAVLKCGAAYVPIEPSMPNDRIKFILDETEAEFVITNPDKAERFYYLDADTCCIPQGLAINAELRYPDYSQPDDTAYILYTSGSTGLPKGVMVSNANVCHYVRAFRKEFNPHPGDVMLQYSVCTFDIFVEEVYTTLLSGATLAIAPEAAKQDIWKLLHFVDRNKVTIISGFPYLLLEMNKVGSLPKSLRLLISGGDVLRYRYIDKLLPLVTIYNTYGPSETTVCASYQCVNNIAPDLDGTYSIGRPVQDVRMEIRDGYLRPVPDGKPGEICIIGGGVSKGYLGNRQVENSAYVIMEDGDRLYRSGDLGVRNPDGSFHFLHRKDNQVMILGKRVETCEVENVLLQCPEVESGIVCADVDNMGLAFLVAYFVPKNPKTFSLDALKNRMARFLPPYMIPEYFVKLDTMPLTANGKIDKRALPRITKIAAL